MVLGHFAVLALNFCYLFTSEGIYMYYILIKRQIIRLSNGISNIKIGKRMLLKINNKNEK